MKIRQAVILAAGLGTRLRPLTMRTPKPLIKVYGKPLLSYHIASLRQHGIERIFIKTFYKNDLFEEFVSQSTHEDLTLIFEGSKTLGTAGFLWKNAHMFDDEMLIVYGDNLTTINYTRFVDHFSDGLSDFGIAVFYARNLADKGRVKFDAQGYVQSITEKPKGNVPDFGFANAGIYFFRKEVLKEFHFDQKECDFVDDIIPALLDRRKLVKIYKMDERLIDIGTPEGLVQANKFAKENSRELG